METEQTARIIRIGTSETSKAPRLNLEDTKPHVLRVASAKSTPTDIKLALEEPTVSLEDTQEITRRVSKTATQPSTPIPGETKPMEPVSLTTPGDPEQTRAVRVVTNDTTLSTPVVLPEPAALKDTQPIRPIEKVTEKPPPTTRPQPTVPRPEVTPAPTPEPTTPPTPAETAATTTMPTGRTQPEAAVQPPAPPESTQEFPKEVEFRKLVQRQAERILNKALSAQYRFKNGILEGHVRGRLAEINSSMLSVKECETVFASSPNIRNNVYAVTFETALQWKPGEITKEKVLGRALERASEEQKEELVRRLATPGAKTLYEESVMPDGLLENEDQVIVGFTEVKAYTPQEFDTYLQTLLDLDQKGELSAQPHSPKVQVTIRKSGQTMELGPDIDGEITFVDELRFLGFGDERLRKGTAILLRFPSDVSSASLQQFGELLRDKFDYEHVMIQKLPLSSKQLSEYEQGIRRDQAAKMLEQAENGSYKLSKEGIEEEQDEKLQLLRNYCSPKKTIPLPAVAPEASKPMKEVTSPVENAEIIERASETAHELWKDVFRRQMEAQGKPVERWKELNPDNAIDRATINRWSPRFRYKDNKPEVDIYQVGFHETPAKIQESTKTNVRIAMDAIQDAIESVQPMSIQKERVLELIHRDIQEVRDTLSKAQRGDTLTREDIDLLSGVMYSGVMKTASDIHVSWVTDNAKRTELQQEFFKLDPFEQEKDVIFIQAAVESLRQTQPAPAPVSTPGAQPAPIVETPEALATVTPEILKATEAAKSGNKTEARRLLEEILEKDEANETAWLELASVVDTPREKRICLEQVLELNPKNEKAQKALEQLQSIQPAPKPRQEPIISSEDVKTAILFVRGFPFADIAGRFPKTTQAIEQELQALRTLKDNDPVEKLIKNYQTLKKAMRDQLVATREIFDRKDLLTKNFFSEEEIKAAFFNETGVQRNPQDIAERIINRYAAFKGADEKIEKFNPASTQPLPQSSELDKGIASTAETSPLLPSGQQIVDFVNDRESNFDGVYQDRLRDVAGQLTIQASVETQRKILTQTSRMLDQMEQDFLKAKGSWGKINVDYAKQLSQMIGQALNKLPK